MSYPTVGSAVRAGLRSDGRSPDRRRRPEVTDMFATSSRSTGPAHRVAVIGAGLAGLFAARTVRRAPVEVTLIDRAPYHQLRPLLYRSRPAFSPRAVSHRRSGRSCASGATCRCCRAR
ncbi:FAD-dependent oxidoreductase [Nocardia sp. alder85J]|uniref:FAD-dependent oxidoreductase n=1 Tax=Nocardia sp. alder85J TaxID=2862949 RepID=UPI003A4DE529